MESSLKEYNQVHGLSIGAKNAKWYFVQRTPGLTPCLVAEFDVATEHPQFINDKVVAIFYCVWQLRKLLETTTVKRFCVCILLIVISVNMISSKLVFDFPCVHFLGFTTKSKQNKCNMSCHCLMLLVQVFITDLNMQIKKNMFISCLSCFLSSMPCQTKLLFYWIT